MSESRAIHTVHFVSATALFLLLSYFSLHLFTKTKKDASPSPEKEIRNRVYVACGVIILACITSITLTSLFSRTRPWHRSSLCSGWSRWHCGSLVGRGS